MALKPCKVCGTLNAEGVETCLSCGHDPEGSKKPAIFRYVAIALIICLALPLLSGLINWILLQLKPESPTPSQPQVSLMNKNLNPGKFKALRLQKSQLSYQKNV